MGPLRSPRPALRIHVGGLVREGAGSDHLEEVGEVEEVEEDPVHDTYGESIR